MRYFSRSFLFCSYVISVTFDLSEGAPVLFHDKKIQNNPNPINSAKVVNRNRNKKPSDKNSERMCAWYEAQACRSIVTSIKLQGAGTIARPRILPRIVGGIKSLPEEYPHMALLGYGVRSLNISWECGGTLISEKYILTAAHCITSSLGKPSLVRLGELNLSTTNDDTTTIDYPIVKIIVHPKYAYPLVYNDIALIRIAAISSFTNHIRPICLNALNDFRTSKVTALGWGVTAYGETKSNYLLSVDLNIQPNGCKVIYTKDTRLPGGFDDRTMICAGYAPGGRDSCGGDSGGPLQITNANSKCSRSYKQVGIISYGMGCASPGTPAIYTRVSHFIPWIESIIWKRKLHNN